jgi:hypothetical protein
MVCESKILTGEVYQPTSKAFPDSESPPGQLRNCPTASRKSKLRRPGKGVLGGWAFEPLAAHRPAGLL